jgi:hypothetical protein
MLLAIFSVAIMSSCQTKNTTTEKTVKVTTKEMGTEGFILKKVIKGDTVWGYSDEAYGTGLQWREIVAENPFLNESGRVYYDQGRGKWIVIIYPGETIRIRGQIITPAFTSEETMTTITTETIGIPWWGWLIIILGGIAFIFFLIGTIDLFSFHRNRPYYESRCYCHGKCNYPSVNYRSSTDGDISVCSQGAGDFSFTRRADGETSFTVRR